MKFELPPPSGSNSRSSRATRTASIALAAVILALSISTLAWLHRDTAPPLWDSAQYLQHSAILYRALTTGGLGGFLEAFSSSLDRKAPLIAALPIPLFAVLGESHESARYVNLIWIVLSSYALFRIGRMLFGDWAALFCVVLLQTFPLVAGMSRQFLVEYGLMTLVILWMYCLLRWQRGESAAAPWILGVILGFGLLLKVTFPLYVTVPTLLVLGRRTRTGESIRQVAIDLAKLGATALPIAATWYARNIFEVTRFVFDAGFGAAARPYGTGPVFSPMAIAAYWLRLVNSGISGLYGLIFLVVFAGFCFSVLRRRRPLPPGMDRHELRLVLAWWLVPFLALTMATNKDVRYSIAYLPALVLLFVGAATTWIPRHRQATALTAIAVAGILNYSVLSFGMPRIGSDIRLGGLNLLSSNTAWAHPPEADPWPGDEVLRTVAQDAAQFHQDRVRVRVLFSHPRINAHVLNYLATLHDLTPRFTTVHFQNPQTLDALVTEINTGYDYVLAKSGSLGPDVINGRNREVVAALEAGKLRFSAVASVAMPDGSRISIYRRAALVDR